MVPKTIVEARSSVPISNGDDIAVESLSASLASERSVKSIIEVVGSVNVAPPSFPGITGIPRVAYAVHAAHQHHHHRRRRHVDARSTRAADIQTVTQTIYLINVDKGVSNLVPVTATNAPAIWPSTGTNDPSATKHTHAESSKASNDYPSIAPIIFVIVISLTIVIALLWSLTRWLRQRRSLSQKRASQQQEPDPMTGMMEVSQPPAAILVGEETAVVQTPASKISNGSTVSSRKAANRDQSWVSGGTSV
ncbi:hypothetical protein MMC22_010784 [Lobaria immixta]|nr:hypothetical protein [Lobaria immixta]